MHDGYHEVDLANGGRFEGEIRDGEPNGPGMMLFPDGTIYIGEFRAGIFHGLGIKYLPEGNRAGVERFEGEFRDGRFQTEYNDFRLIQYILRMGRTSPTGYPRS